MRINAVLDEIPDIDDQPDAQPLPRLTEDIRLAGVEFSYTPGRPVLEDIDVVIPAGKRVAFVGPSGAGKSSILQLLTRFYDPDEGAVLFDGRDIRRATLASVRNQIGVVFQDSFLFASTIRDNIALGKPGATDAEVEAAARAAEIDDFIDSMPQRYDTLVGERGGRLSGGQRQRISIARALDSRPSNPDSRRGDLGSRPSHRAAHHGHARTSKQGPNDGCGDAPAHIDRGIRRHLRRRRRTHC